MKTQPIICTLLFLIKGDEILLAMKKRGFGAGRWNGVGGKITEGETIEQAVGRECQEEISVTPVSLTKVAIHEFVFPDGAPQMLVHTYLCDSWHGEPIESEEMSPHWFRMNAIPFADMWQDDIYWLPTVLAGKKLRCSFTFDHQDTLIDGKFTVVGDFE